MIIPDTNVLSELFREAPASEVVRWAASRPMGELVTTSITEAEIRYGTATMADGRRRRALLAVLDETLTDALGGRVLPFDSAAAKAYAPFRAARRAAGKPVLMADAQIAGIAISRGMAVATRNTADFEGCGVTLINPWTA